MRGQPHHCICTNASCGLSATAEFLVGDMNADVQSVCGS